MSRPPSERPRARQVLSHLGVMVVVSAILGVVVAGLAIPFAGVVGFGARNVAESLDDLPRELDTETLPQKTTIVDPVGNPIATVFDENRVNVRLDQISRTMVKALVSIEDYRFYEHGALDFRGTVRAFVTNQAASGVVQGGSSLTQQLVKLTLLSQADTEEEQAAVTDDTYKRKFDELRYAVAVEQRHSKDWILERYLNTAYFGDGAYGVQAAAQHYFNVNARKLDLNQSAILAGLVQNPTAFDPTNYPDRAANRRNVVLDRMAELKVITSKRAERVKGGGLGLDTQKTKNGCLYSAAPFFCDYAISFLMKDRALGKTVEDRKRLIFSGGLTIKTTIDLRFQKAADDSVRAAVNPTDNAIGALAMVEPGTGNVRAIAQSRPMGRNKDAGETFLNYVVPREYGDANGFQPGSTFKVFVLAAAINQGTALNESISSPQQVFLPSSSFETCDGPYQSSEIWDPQNSTGSGTFDLYSGTQNSVNTFFAQLEQRTGICDPYNLAKDMGIRLDDPAREMVPSFTLGVADVSPLEMAEAYATFANRGLHCDARPVSAILDADGKMLKEYPPTCTQVMPSSTADAVNDILRGVQEGGFGSGAGIDLDSRDDAGKTGTTNSELSVWFAGYTPSLAAAAVVAGANEEGSQISLTGQSVGPGIVYSASGSTTAGPIWGDAMQAIEFLLPDEEFTRPNSSDVAGVLSEVPAVTGETLESATAIMEDAGFTVLVGASTPSEYEEGDVVSTSPDAGTELSGEDTVVLYPSSGPPPRTNDGGGGNGGNGGNNGGGDDGRKNGRGNGNGRG